MEGKASPRHIQVLMLQCLCTNLGHVLSHLPPQCKALVLPFQFLCFDQAFFLVEQVSNVLTSMLTKLAWAVSANVCANSFQYKI